MKHNSGCFEDVSCEYYREYRYYARVDGCLVPIVKRVNFPKLFRVVGHLQQVEDRDGKVHFNPDVGHQGCELIIEGDWSCCKREGLCCD